MVIVEDITVLYIPALLRTIKLNGSYYLSVRFTRVSFYPFAA